MSRPTRPNSQRKYHDCYCGRIHPPTQDCTTPASPVSDLASTPSPTPPAARRPGSLTSRTTSSSSSSSSIHNTTTQHRTSFSNSAPSFESLRNNRPRAYNSPYTSSNSFAATLSSTMDDRSSAHIPAYPLPSPDSSSTSTLTPLMDSSHIFEPISNRQDRPSPLSSSTPSPPATDMDIDIEAPNKSPPTPTPSHAQLERGTKRRRLSITSSTPTDHTSSNTAQSSEPHTEPTQRPRRAVTKDSRAKYVRNGFGTATELSSSKTKAKARGNAKKVCNGNRKRGGSGKGEGKAKGAGKGKEKGKNAMMREVNGDDEESDEEDDFECPCGGGCGNIAFCEAGKKESEGRDVGTSVILSSSCMVTLVVGSGDEEQEFIVHKELLALHSGFFAALFAPTSSPSSTTPDTSPAQNGIESPLAGQESETELTPSMKLESNTDLKQTIKAEPEVEFKTPIKAKKVTYIEIDSDDEVTILEPEEYKTNLDLAKNRLLTPMDTPTPKKSGGSSLHASDFHGSSKSSTFNSTPTSSIPNNIPPLSATPNPAKSSTATPSAEADTKTQNTYTLPPTILPLPLTLYISYIYTGSLTSSLLTITDTRVDSSWEKLWALGYILRDTGFMNYSMEGLRELKTVHDGTWPRAKEAIWIWGLKLDLGVEDGKLNFNSGPGSGSESTDETTSPTTTLSPLHIFTATLIAFNSPLTTLTPNTPLYNAWERLLSRNSSLSLAVHAVDVKRFTEAGKGPWDDAFRVEWRVAETSLAEKWKAMLREGRRVNLEKKRRGETVQVRGGVKAMLEKLALTGQVDKEGEEAGESETEDELFEESGEEEVDELEWDTRRRRRVKAKK